VEPLSTQNDPGKQERETSFPKSFASSTQGAQWVVTSPGITAHVCLKLTDVLEDLKENIMVQQIERDTHLVGHEGNEVVEACWKNRRKHSSTKQQHSAKLSRGS